jgi:Animal haem peroxidase
MSRRHSKPPRGLEAYENKSTEPKQAGRFGRLFPAQNQQLPDKVLTALAESMEGDGPDEDNSIVDGDFADENQHKLEGSEVLRIPAGYTYLGQFIDHDLTFDPTSSLESSTDVEATLNFRTPRFDLDCVYGSGPDDQPYMYEADGIRLVEGAGGDVLRLGGRAVIGDPRNDENHIVMQWHRIIIRFHNRVVGWLSHDPSMKGKLFEESQKIVRWTYQWLIVNDFLPRILNTKTWLKMKQTTVKNKKGPFGDQLKTTFNEPFMPVEFSGAAYRFGHSLVRPSYHMNDSQVRLRDGGHEAEGGNRVPIFDLSEPNLNGFRPLTQPGATVPLIIEWKYFFHFTDSSGSTPEARNVKPILKQRGELSVFEAVETIRAVVQPSYRIDTMLVEPLSRLDIPGVANKPPRLSERNLQRGARLRLPSGQSVADSLGIPKLTKQELLLEEKPGNHEPESRDALNNEIVIERLALLQKAGADIDQVATNSPLWYYILAEAQMQEDGANLGGVGSTLVGGTFLGLLLGDKTSYLKKEPAFDPAKALHLERVDPSLKLATVADLIKLVAPESVGRMGILHV